MICSTKYPRRETIAKLDKYSSQPGRKEKKNIEEERRKEKELNMDEY